MKFASTMQPDGSSNVRAVTYYRQSTQDQHENTIPIQRDKIREWAQQHGVEIIEEFADHDKPGLTAKGRSGFLDMLENWVKKRDDFTYILCLDASRWSRLQDIGFSDQYCAECKKHGKQVFYIAIDELEEDDLRSMFRSNDSEPPSRPGQLQR